MRTEYRGIHEEAQDKDKLVIVQHRETRERPGEHEIPATYLMTRVLTGRVHPTSAQPIRHLSRLNSQKSMNFKNMGQSPPSLYMFCCRCPGSRIQAFTEQLTTNKCLGWVWFASSTPLDSFAVPLYTAPRLARYNDVLRALLGNLFRQRHGLRACRFVNPHRHQDS